MNYFTKNLELHPQWSRLKAQNQSNRWTDAQSYSDSCWNDLVLKTVLSKASQWLGSSHSVRAFITRFLDEVLWFTS